MVPDAANANAYTIHTGMRAQWVQDGGAVGRWGVPLSDEYPIPGGAAQKFAGGVMTYPRLIAPPISSYAGHIVKWSGETPTPVTSWYVTADLKRLWIPDGGTYNCFKARAAPGPDLLPSTTLNQLPDQAGKWAPCGDNMGVNRVLRRGMNLKSSDGRYQWVLQTDGNLVLYGPSGRPIWANGRFTTQFVIMQGDGNMVGYTDAGGVTWATNTAGTGTANRLVIQSDGNAVIYAGSRAVWATNTVGRT